MFERLFARLTGKGSVPSAPKSSGGGKLPPIAPPKVPNKQQSYPSYILSTTPNTSRIPQRDQQLATTDIVQQFRIGRNTAEVMRNLARAQPDLAAAVSAYIRVGVPEHYIAIARNPDGSVNDDGCRLVFEILSRFDKMADYQSGFSQVGSIRTNSEALAKEAILYGAMAQELVLDKGRLPLKFQPVAVPTIYFYEDTNGGTRGLRPVQLIGGVEVDLDQPTFMMVYLDPSLLDPYPQGPLEAALQSVLASAQFLSDLRRVMARHVHPRYDISIDEEKLKLGVPPDILQDPDKLPEYLNGVISEVEQTINDLGVEEALVHYNFIVVQYIKNADGQGDAEKFRVLKEIIDSNLAKGAKTMPAILGNGAGSQNIASTETVLFMLSANSMVRLKLQELYSKSLTLAVRLFGLDVVVEFEFDPIELRPESELEAFRTMYQDRIKDQWSLGLIGDMEASLRLTGKPIPPAFKTLTGTYFMTGTDPVTGLPMATGAKAPGAENPYSGTSNGGGQSGGGAANQSRNTGTPKDAKSSK